VGDNTVDRYLHLGKMFPGGNAVNVPVLAHRLGSPAAYLGWLAKDPHGMLVYNALIKEGVDVSRCHLVDGQNAFCEVTQKDGDRVFGNFSEGVCDQIDLNKEDLQFISTFDLVHTSVYSFITPFLKQLKEASKVLSYDFSSEWDKDSLAKTLPFVNIALISNPVMNIDENKELINFAYSFGPDIVLVTSGEQGALLFDGSQFYRQEIIQMGEVVDTLGAGDAFAACFMVNYLNAISIQESLQKAAKFAAETCKYYGAFGHGAPL
jgi:fructoselysine 6-kinase